MPSRSAVEVIDAGVVPGVVRLGDDSLGVATTDGQYLALGVAVEEAGLTRLPFPSGSTGQTTP